MEDYGLVSVIIPVYNVEKYLEECLDSVMNQTYQNFEVILVDDGSTDSSGRICDEYKKRDNRIYVIHQENGGLSVARNRGYLQASGEYVYFLDSDDWILPETLSGLIETATAQNADIVFFDAFSFTDDSESFKIKQRYFRKNVYKSENGEQVFSKLQDNNEYHGAVPLLFFKKSFIKENNISFLPGILYEDMLFTYEAFCKAGIVAQNSNAFYQRRYRNNSIVISRKNKKNYISAHIVFDKVIELTIQLENIEEDFAKKYICRCAFNAINIYNQLSRYEQRESKSDYKKLKQDIINNKAFGNKALLMRCYGVFPWFCYKIYEKSFLRILKGSK